MKQRIALTVFGTLVTASTILALVMSGLILSAGDRPQAQGPRLLAPEAVYASFADLDHMVHFVPVIARVRYVKDLGSYNLPLDTPVPDTSPVPTPQPGSIQAWKARQAPSSAPGPVGPAPADEGPLETDMLATVVDAIKGADLSNGNQVVITVDSGNSVPAVGQEEIVFMSRNALDSAKYAAIAPMRFQVGSNGTVTTSPGAVAQVHDGESAATFVADIHSAMNATIH